MTVQSTIVGPSSAVPAATFPQSLNVTGTTDVVMKLNSGRYLLRVVTSLGGANAGPAATFFAY